MRWIAGQPENASLLRTMSFVKIKAFQKGGVHQIHKIMFFLATSYDPFKNNHNQVNAVGLKKMTEHTTDSQFAVI